MVKTGKDIAIARKHLEAGELVAIPTETVYGLAANGRDANAVLKIFEAKNRPSFNPLILHVDSLEKAKELTASFPPKAQQLAEAFWPGALTLILPRATTVPDIVTAGLDTVGVRIPNHPLTLSLLSELDFPLAAPSANPSGYVSPTSPNHVQEQLGDQIAYILDGGDCQVGIESTIVKVDGEIVRVLRLGGLALEEIERVVGPVEVATTNTTKPESPGMLLSHYAPAKPLILGNLTANIDSYSNQKVGVLSFSVRYPEVPDELQLILSPNKDLHEAARNIFGYLRQLDAMDVEVILAELLPEEGLGRAINDRLKRAASR